MDSSIITVEEHLNVIIISEAPNIDEDEIEELFESIVKDVAERETKGTMMVLNMNSVVRLARCTTIKLVVKIYGYDAIIFVISGSTHNFRSSTANHLMQLPIKKTAEFKVTIGNGQQVCGSKVCEEVRIDVQ